MIISSVEVRITPGKEIDVFLEIWAKDKSLTFLSLNSDKIIRYPSSHVAFIRQSNCSRRHNSQDNEKLSITSLKYLPPFL